MIFFEPDELVQEFEKEVDLQNKSIKQNFWKTKSLTNTFKDEHAKATHLDTGTNCLFLGLTAAKLHVSCVLRPSVL